ncbi:ATP-binding cassette sub-family C member 4 isoform X2 [Nematostella vectensis]|nr:ATP-binding cassette sub-family C member 4 isoform X2 [Nematostella vectensis]
MEKDESKRLTDKLERLWKEEKEAAKSSKRKPSLSRSFVRFLGTHFMLIGLFAVAEEGMRITQPYFIGKLVSYFVPGSTTTKQEAYIYAAIMSIFSCVMAMVHHPLFFQTFRCGFHLRIACSTMVYRKAMRLSHSAYSTVTTGHIINLLTSDVQILERVAVFLHHLWIAPVLLLVTSVISWYELGPYCLPGVIVVVLIAPLQGWLGKKFAVIRNKTALQTDKRFRIMNEVISGMRVIKMYTWERPFANLVADVRSQEVSIIRKAAYLRSVNAVIYAMCIPVIGFAMFAPYVLTGHALSPEKVFTVIALFYSIRVSLTIFLPECIRGLKESKVSAKRLQSFLLRDEKHSMKGVRTLTELKEGETASVKANNFSARWNDMISTPTLQGINFELKPSDLLMVVGPVGAGKSSLLMCLLGELPLTSGYISVEGRVSYASQQAWIFSGSVRENILFGKEYEEAKYWRVIKACAMERDMRLFPNGDETLVGEKGVALSGGQKARINLARAVYYDADIVLLDDPLSAVDTHVGRQLFDECVCGLLKDRICVLVTHQLQHLKGATDIICLQDGRCVGQGSYAELSEAGLDVMSLVSALSAGDHDNIISPDMINVPPSSLEKPLANGSTRPGYQKISGNVDDAVGDDCDEVLGKRGLADLARELSVQSLAKPEGEVLAREPSKEGQHTGTVTWQVYIEYFKAGASPCVRSLIVMLLFGSQAVVMVGEWWLAKWADSEKEKSYLIESYRGTNSTPPPPADLTTHEYIYIYCGMICAGMVTSLVCAMMLYNFFVTASQHLHDNMFSRVLRAPIYFFDTNPVGRVVNRFAKDINQMDDVLPAAFYDFLRLSILTFAILLLNVASMPFLLVGAIPMTVLFGYIRNYYLRTSREVKRLEAINRSPVYSHLSTSLTGLITIRAFQAEQAFIRSYHAYTDFHTGSYFLFHTTQRWLGFRLDIICASFFTLATFTSLFIVEGGLTISASVVGLCLTYATQLTGMFQWCIRQSAEVENNMTSVERVIEYSQIDQEVEPSKPLTAPDDWPHAGTITAESLYYSYHQSLPHVLKNVKFSIRNNEKVGIVGRTGAGKSSLLAVLFRLNNPEGLVRIDGLPITDLKLQDLRSAISIIPQDPVLFSGTLRKNLDPFTQFSDDALWNALEEVQLKEAVDELPDGIETELAEGGSNFSVGQRQLVCLARAILSHNKILVIDEATANVDHSTDSLIQETIRNKFHDCTVLTIAHRLNTVMDSDSVMVLDAGRLVEFDEPYVLLLNSQGFFSQLVEQTGEKTAANLRESARQAYELRHDNDAEDTNGVRPDDEPLHDDEQDPNVAGQERGGRTNDEEDDTSVDRQDGEPGTNVQDTKSARQVSGPGEEESNGTRKVGDPGNKQDTSGVRQENGRDVDMSTNETPGLDTVPEVQVVCPPTSVNQDYTDTPSNVNDGAPLLEGNKIPNENNVAYAEEDDELLAWGGLNMETTPFIDSK